MGCQANIYVGEFDADLEAVADGNERFERYDQFYNRAQRRLQSIKQDIQETERHMHRFLKHTGIEGKSLSLGYALLAMVVAIVAENKCELMAVDLQFDSKFPGILLRTAGLSPQNAKTYERWCTYSKHLRICIDKLASYIEDIPQYTSYSRIIPDELVRIAYEEGKPVVEFCHQEAKALENTMKLEKAEESLNSLIDVIHATIYESTDMIDNLRDPRNGMIDGIMTVAEKAHKEGNLTTEAVMLNYQGMLERIIPGTTQP